MNALALIDGDNFGIINEKYGHAAGNIVIYHIAKMIENCIRCSDVLIRYEGDKFLLLMENISSQMFEMKLKRIAEACDAAGVRYEFKKMKSGFVVCFYRSEEKTDKKPFFASTHKTKGRNHHDQKIG